MILNLERNKKYILACSYGPDSMALFNMLLDENYRFVVCNINYNHRDISTQETENLKAYCEAKNIEFYSKSVQFPSKNLNFESRAREIRYNFFYKIGEKLNIYDILIAHNEDDLLETYLMQKERDGVVNYYGLKELTRHGKFEIHRPILKYPKADLEFYCKTQNIPFSIDVSNFDETYKRNYFRHSVLAKMSKEEKHNLQVEIINKNLDLELKNLRIGKYINQNSINKNDLLNLNFDDAYYLIIRLINKDEYHGEFSKDSMNDLLFALKKNAKSWSYKFKDGYILKFNYENITLINKNIYYEEIIQKDFLESEHFQINSSSKYYDKINNSKYFIIKPCKCAKIYEGEGVKKTINRLFIDWKVPHEIREIWPGVFNESGELLYIPRYQKVPIISNNSLLLFSCGDILEIK